MYCHVGLVSSDVSEERVTSIFRVKKSASEEQFYELARNCSLADFSTLKIEAIRSSETLVLTRSTRHLIPDGSILQYIVWSLATSVLEECPTPILKLPLYGDIFTMKG
jgi:hypothetical protein